MDRAAEVARIKADFAARDAAWRLAIRARLAQGAATSQQLVDACGSSIEGPFWSFHYDLRREGVLVAVGITPGPKGDEFLWEWAGDD